MGRTKISLGNFLAHLRGTIRFVFHKQRRWRSLFVIIVFLICTDGGYKFLNFWNQIALNGLGEIILADSYVNLNNYIRLYIYDMNKDDVGVRFIAKLIAAIGYNVEEYWLSVVLKISTGIIMILGIIRSFDDVLILVGNRYFDLNDDFVARGTTVGRSVDEISAVYFILALYVHCMLECVLGFGTGSSWASDYIVVIAAAWIFRSAPVWSELAISRRREQVEQDAEVRAKAAVEGLTSLSVRP